jgi:hypothetical protein
MTKPLPKHYIEKLKMAVVFGECGRECLSGPGNTEYLPAVPVRQQAGLLAVPARPALNRGGPEMRRSVYTIQYS